MCAPGKKARDIQIIGMPPSIHACNLLDLLIRPTCVVRSIQIVDNVTLLKCDFFSGAHCTSHVCLVKIVFGTLDCMNC